MSLAIGYVSLAQLRRDAAAVALLKPTGATTVTAIEHVPFTVATVNVLETVSGAPLPSTLGLRQTGAAGAFVQGCPPLVSRSDVYIAYVAPFEFQRGGPIAGQYVVVGGGQGLFRHAGPAPPANESAESFMRVHPSASSSLPAQISISQARQS
jgi:hypothetical protein